MGHGSKTEVSESPIGGKSSICFPNDYLTSPCWIHLTTQLLHFRKVLNFPVNATSILPNLPLIDIDLRKSGQISTKLESLETCAAQQQPSITPQCTTPPRNQNPCQNLCKNGSFHLQLCPPQPATSGKQKTLS